jgi:hypothetical protein
MEIIDLDGGRLREAATFVTKFEQYTLDGSIHELPSHAPHAPARR